MSTTKLRVATWNILADSLCTDDDQGFPFSSPEERDPHRRARLQYKILAQQKAEVIALQEVDDIDRLQPFLEAMGYAVQYTQRETAVLGTVLAVKKTLLIIFSRIELPDDRQLNTAMLDVEGRRVIVATTHLKAKAEGEESRKRQIARILEASNVTPCILLGDFNDTPDSPCIREMANAGFASAIDGPDSQPVFPFTTMKKRKGPDGQTMTVSRVEDYIFFKGLKLASSQLELPERVNFASLPTKYYPSDHLLLKAEFHLNH